MLPRGGRTREGCQRSRGATLGPDAQEGASSRRDSRRVSEGPGCRRSGSREGLRGVGGPAQRRSRETVNEDLGPRSSASQESGHDDSPLHHSWEETGSLDGGLSLSDSWEAVSEDRGYAGSDSSGASGYEDAGRRSFWETPGEDRGARPGDAEGHGRSEDRGSRGPDSLRTLSASSRAMPGVTPGVAEAGPTGCAGETETPCESDWPRERPPHASSP